MVEPAIAKALPPGLSVMQLLMEELGPEFDAWLESLDPLTALMVKHDWSLWARPSQRKPEGDWEVWIIMAGRGYGKTRPGSETVIDWSIELGQMYGKGHIGLIGKDPEDVRKVMIEGESGILACSPPWYKPHFEPTKKSLTWPNGVVASYYSSEEPDDLRGPQHHKLWGDEICKWKHAEDVWDMASFGLRLGHEPQALITTTPRPIEVLKKLIKDAKTVVTGGHMNENRVNLASTFLKRMKEKYEGTRLGRQELAAELLSDTPGALWTLGGIDRDRIDPSQMDMELYRIALAVDPAATDPEEMRRKDPELMDELAETGIVVCGQGANNHLYVLHDFSGQYSPNEWGIKAATHYETLKCESLIGEVNNGGAMVEHVIKVAARELGYDVNFKAVHASRGKRTRAEPVAALYEQGRGHHVGMFPELEDQMSTWVPGMKSPDRMDALVWGATEVMLLSPDALVYR